MTVRFELTHPRLGNWGVTLPAYQWGYTSGTEYFVRADQTTPWGSRSWQPMPTVSRVLMTVTFRNADSVLDTLRTLTVLAHRFVRPVRFYPNYDADPGSWWTLDWDTEASFGRVLDNRQEVVVRIVTQANVTV